MSLGKRVFMKLARCLLAPGLLMASIGPVISGESLAPRRLVEVVDIANLSMSPDGSNVAFRVEQASIERNTYDTVWFVQDMLGMKPPRRIADGGVPLRDTAGIVSPMPAIWSPDGEWIYYRALIDGKIDVWRAAADGSGARPLTHDAADVRDFWLSPDGDVLTYSVGPTREAVLRAERAEYDNGIHVDENVPIGGQGLFRSAKTTGRLATQRYTGLWFDRQGLLADVPDRLKALNLQSGDKRDIVASKRLRPSAGELPQLDEPLSTFSVEPTGDRVAVLARSGGDPELALSPFAELSVVSGASPQRSAVCSADACVSANITGVTWRPESDEVIFTVTDEGQGRSQTIYRWEVGASQVDMVVQSRGLINGGRDIGSSCAASRIALACVAAEAGSPPRLERVDLRTGKRTPLFVPNQSLAIDIAELIQVELLEWTDHAGQTYTGQLFRPRDGLDDQLPLFITYYSCTGFLRGGVGDEWPLASLAARGVGALCINYAPLRMDAVERYDQGLAAVNSVVDLLAGRGDIDRERIGMGGLSFGSEVALWVAMRSGLLTSISLASPVVSPIYYLLGSLKGEEFLTGLAELWGLGAPDETPEQWRKISPAFNLENIEAPVLFQLPEQEYIQGLDYVMPLIQGLQADLYVFPHEPHQKFQPRHKLAVYERNLDWFRYWLQDYVDTAPEKERQYSHWRRLGFRP